MYKKVLYLLCMASISIKMVGQTAKFSPVSIGQKVPDIPVEYVENGQVKTASLADWYKKKLLVLDFWATWCSPCVEALPRFDSLNKKLAGKAFVLPVAYEKLNKVSGSLQKVFGSRTPITTIVNDSLLSRFFPHRIVPHEVWIDSSGTVKAITAGEDVTEENIRGVQAGTAQLETKIDKMDFNMHDPYEPPAELLQYKSLLTKYNPYINSGFSFAPVGMDPTIKRKRAFAFNNTMLDMLYIAFFHGMPWSGVNMKRVELITSDSTRYFWPDRVMSSAYKSKYKDLLDWQKKNLYCYELILDKETAADVFWGDMLEELNHSLPVKAAVEKRMRACWVLTVKNPTLLKKGTGVPKAIWKQYVVIEKLQNQGIDILLHYLNGLKDIDPVVDETGINYPLDLVVNLPVEFGQEYVDIEQVRKNLNENGLDLVKSKRMVDVLVIKDKTGE